MFKLVNSGFVLDFDDTGTDIANRVVGEPITITGSNIRVIVLRMGAFYADDIALTPIGGGEDLILGKDWFLHYKSAELEARTGQPVYCSIRMADDYTGEFTVEYQAVGGPEGFATEHYEGLKIAIENAQSNAPYWKDVRMKPPTYPHEAHRHLLNHLDDLDKVKQVLEDMTNALINSTQMGGAQNVLKSDMQRLYGQMASMRADINKLASSGAVLSLVKEAQERLDSLSREYQFEQLVDPNAFVDVLVLGKATFKATQIVVVVDDSTDITTATYDVINVGDTRGHGVVYSGGTLPEDLTLQVLETAADVTIQAKWTKSGTLKAKWNYII